jgi:hypothetical protein
MSAGALRVIVVRAGLAGVLAAVLLTASDAEPQCPEPRLYALLPHGYPCPLLRVCATQWGVCAIPHPVQPGTPCSCQAANGAWLAGVCVR